MLNKILKLLDGKKTIILGILMLTAGYFMDKGYIDLIDYTFIGSCLTLLGGGASYATKRLVK